MPEIAVELRHLEDAAQRIARGEALVAEQMRRIEQLRKAGFSAREAECTLQNFKVVLDTIRESEIIIGQTLRDIEVGSLRKLSSDSSASAK